MKGEGLRLSPGDSGAALYNKVPPPPMVILGEGDGPCSSKLVYFYSGCKYLSLTQGESGIKLLLLEGMPRLNT